MTEGSARRFREIRDRFMELHDEAMRARQPELDSLVREREGLSNEIRCLQGEATWEAMEKLKAEQGSKAGC